MEHICFLNTIFGRLKLPGFSVLWFEMHKELREKKRKEANYHSNEFNSVYLICCFPVVLQKCCKPVIDQTDFLRGLVCKRLLSQMMELLYVL